MAVPGGYRRYVIAVFGWPVLAAANYTDPVAERQQAQAQQSIADSLSNIAALEREQSERTVKSKEAEPCLPGDDRRYSDLCAQWKAADAATLAAWLTGGSFAAVIIALWLAFQSNRIARNTSAIENRAWIEIVEAKGIRLVQRGANKWQADFNVHITNIGKTVARNVSIEFFALATIEGGHGKIPRYKYIESSMQFLWNRYTSAIFPSRSMQHNCACHFDGASSFFDGIQHGLNMKIIVTYYTVFEMRKPRRTEGIFAFGTPAGIRQEHIGEAPLSLHARHTGEIEVT